jgi:hypothetical protein
VDPPQARRMHEVEDDAESRAAGTSVLLEKRKCLVKKNSPPLSHLEPEIPSSSKKGSYFDPPRYATNNIPRLEPPRGVSGIDGSLKTLLSCSRSRSSSFAVVSRRKKGIHPPNAPEMMVSSRGNPRFFLVRMTYWKMLKIGMVQVKIKNGKHTKEAATTG